MTKLEQNSVQQKPAEVGIFKGKPQMAATLAPIFLYLAISSCYCYWNQTEQTKQETMITNGQVDYHEPRVRMQRASGQSVYEYVYYTDILMEGFSTALVEAYITSPSVVPYTLVINSSITVSMVKINVTTECNVTDTGKTCSCVSGYTWNITVCYTYKPCSNSSAFCSCLFIPNDLFPFCEDPKNITDTRVNISGSFTMNETFTPDLLDASSVKYQALQSNLTLALLNVYTQICNPLSVTIVGFSPGSVVASYTMAVSGTVSAAQLSSTNALVSATLPSVISSQIFTTGVASIQPSQLEVKFLDPIQLTCQINDTMSNVNWTLTTNNVTNMVFSAGTNVNVSNQQLPGQTVSVLTIVQADQLWEGTYVCQFFNDTLVHVASAQVNVTLLPSDITINPPQKSLLVQDTSKLLLQCCVSYDGEAYVVTWTYNNMTFPAQTVTSPGLECYTLAPPHPANDTNYTCTFTNKAGQTKSNYIPVYVIQAADKYCTANVSSSVTWNITKAGVSASTICPSGQSGYIMRDCSADGVWLSVQDNCISLLLQTALSSVQMLEKGLGNAQVVVPNIIQQVFNNSRALLYQTAEVTAAVTLLGSLANIAAMQNCAFDSVTVTNFLSLASNITDPSYFSLWSDKNSPPASQVLQSVELFCQLLQADNGTFEIDLQNIQLKGSAYDQGSVGDTYKKTFSLDLGVSMSIDQQVITPLLLQQDVKITSIVFSTIGDLLPNTFEKKNDSQLNSVVQSTSIKLSNSSYVSSKIQMSFMVNISTQSYTQHCVFWDYSLAGSGGSWSDSGCTSKTESNTTYCSCNHLTSFAVLMSIHVESLTFIEEITYVGLGVSIFSLCLCILFEGLAWKSVTRSNISYFRHTSLVNIASCLLCADIFFLSSAFPSATNNTFICMSITFLNHFFYLALFFWTFAQSVMLLHQLLFVFHHLRKTVYVSLSFTSGYFFPGIIAAGTFLYYYPKGKYRHQAVCWLNPASGAIYAFAVPAGCIIVFNFLTLLVVIAMLSRPSVSDAKHSDDKETAKNILKAVVVLTPVFGLTWSFGFALLTNLDDLTRQVFTYGFAAMNAFQGFFILLTCITEKKVREAVFKKTSSTTTSTSTAMSTSEAPSKTM
ncbi:adhesion G-protein coupled receptor F3-like [Hyperolius riggenbachi]|uniref:adhesion G-protein coupled receptor F3-like n=1 Tax=Hyperolius riggenbachi TaxID=752182 RepID=UPI0035A2D66F